MHFDLLLAFATLSILVSPVLIDFWKYREVRKPRKNSDPLSTFGISSRKA